MTEPAPRISRAEAELEALEEVFKALAHPTRRHVLLVIHFRGGMTAGEIARRFSCAWPTTSRHLRVLEAAGLVTVIKQGRQRHYQVNSKRLLAVAGGWLEWFQEEES